MIEKNIFYHFQPIFSHLICLVQVALELSLHYSFTYLQFMLSNYVKYQSSVYKLCFQTTLSIKPVWHVFVLTIPVRSKNNKKFS